MKKSLLNISKSLMPRFVLNQIRQLRKRLRNPWVQILRVLAPAPWPRRPDGKLFLNLGCGSTTHPDFVNVDAVVERHIHYIRPIDNLSPFADSSVDMIYASHCLEHFGHRELERVVSEWCRVLKPDGILRVGVPDFDQLLAMYEQSGKRIEVIQQVLMGGQTYPLNFHYTAFTKLSLTDLFTRVGFREVRCWVWGSDELTSLNDFTRWTIDVDGRTFHISLNLEAVK